VRLFKDYVLKIETLPDIKIETLKNLIYEIVGLPVESQRLMLDGLPLINIASLKFLNINDKSIIEVYQEFASTIKLCLRYQNLIFRVHVSPACKTKYLKHFIGYKLGIPFGIQILIFDDQRLSDDTSLHESGLSDMDEIFIKILF
jgi:hypothetical protein